MDDDSLHLTSQGCQELRRLLARHCQESNAMAAAVLDQCGTQLAAGGPVAIQDSGEIAALAAGAFASTRELAARVGELAFDGLMHHGAERHFYLSPVGRDFLLLTIFGSGSPSGIVRVCASRTGPAVGEVLEGMRAAPVPAAPFSRGIAPVAETR